MYNSYNTLNKKCLNLILLKLCKIVKQVFKDVINIYDSMNTIIEAQIKLYQR